jgi:hypothetical protein
MVLALMPKIKSYFPDSSKDILSRGNEMFPLDYPEYDFTVYEEED